jgi:cupin domain
MSKTVVIATAVAVAALCSSLSFATPATGVHGQPLARVTVPHALEVKLSGPFDTLVQKVTIAPGGETGWHSHPGPHVIAVAEGALAVYAADAPSCAAQVFKAGTGLYSRGTGDVRNERNEGDVPTVLYVTYFIPVGSAPRTEAAVRPANCKP